jgi:hypothetical protein
MSHATGAEGSDAAVYPELARANLLRMRGDYKTAENQCLTILRRFPNNTTANVLLGDICAEKGDLDQAMQWYEMALDLAPENQAAQYKLEAVRQRFKEKETVQTVEQLGLPTTRSRAGVYAVALIASIFVIAVVAYFLGQRVEQKREVVLPTVTTHTTTSTGETTGTTTGGGTTGSDPPPVPTDDELLKMIQSTGTEGARALRALQDPRTKAVTITYAVLEGEDPRPLGAMIAQAGFEQVTDAPFVTLRAMRKGRMVFVADAMKNRYEDTLTPTWKAEHESNPSAWMDLIMKDPWPPPSLQPAPLTTVDVKPDSLPPGEKPATSTKPDKTTAEKPVEHATAGDGSGPGKSAEQTDQTTTSGGEESPPTEGTAGNE